MTHSSRIRKKSAGGLSDDPELHVLNEAQMKMPGAARLVGLAEQLSAASAQVLQDEAAIVAEEMGKPEPHGLKRKLNAQEASRRAGNQIADLTKLKLENIAEVRKTDSGWLVVATMLELSRIPPSTDVLASYEVSLNAEGDLEGYHRATRYLRDQIGDDL
jgi:hypothetical protein